MRMIDPILMELEQEAGATRRLLERVHEEKMSWKPAPKSMTLGQLALHLATTPGGVAQMATVDVFERPSFEQPEAKSRQELLDAFDGGLQQAKSILNEMDDARLMSTWTFQRDGKPVMQVPRIGILRMIMLNHSYHHRGQLTVYLRELGVPLPSVYGPTADENPFA
ncbi:MAG: DinB family protein [Candidatus Eisenbacteria bacterium]|nr:DinB family protein [Candidatus Eisenbacteria bacterium]